MLHQLEEVVEGAEQGQDLGETTSVDEVPSTPKPWRLGEIGGLREVSGAVQERRRGIWEMG